MREARVPGLRGFTHMKCTLVGVAFSSGERQRTNLMYHLHFQRSGNNHLGFWPIKEQLLAKQKSILRFRLFRIESADLDGSNRRVILDKLPHPFGVSIFGNTIFWTDWIVRKVTRANKLSGGSQKPLTSRPLSYKPMDIHAISSERQNCMS